MIIEHTFDVKEDSLPSLASDVVIGLRIVDRKDAYR